MKQKHRMIWERRHPEIMKAREEALKVSDLGWIVCVIFIFSTDLKDGWPTVVNYNMFFFLPRMLFTHFILMWETARQCGSTAWFTL